MIINIISCRTFKLFTVCAEFLETYLNRISAANAANSAIYLSENAKFI